ncbi:hypothetical protein NIES970_03140 [[Synechococcus] sp. NIES-970]|nr:hypothetical protein NIES970_03140 [[Synechococcus] sp. NIES-970]
MGTQQQARALMMRQHHAIKNRQMSLLNRSASAIGMEADGDYQGKIQGKLPRQVLADYRRSSATMS